MKAKLIRIGILAVLVAGPLFCLCGMQGGVQGGGAFMVRYT